MVSIKNFNEDGVYTSELKVFTAYSEITPEYLAKCVEHIKVSKYHCIIAVCAKISLYELTLANFNRKNGDIKVNTVLAKMYNYDAKDSDNIPCKGEVGDCVIVTRSAIEMGIHIKNNTISDFNNLKAMVNSDKRFLDNLKKSEEFKDEHNPNTLRDGVFINFKLIPVGEIKATYKVDDIREDELIKTI